ncbi:MAG TPA: hypothetical protein DEH25_15335 [Chloroflexi bacterium]|nr:hypothetical protein [Chloroflexota bacterium]
MAYWNAFYDCGHYVLPYGKLTPDFITCEKKMPKQKKRWIVIGIVLVLVIAGLILAANWRTVGKQMANPLRGLLGVQAVAKIETVIFKVQDQIEQWKFDLGLAEAENPFGVAASPIEGSPTPASQVIPPTQTESPTPTENPAEPQSTVDPESLAEPTAIPPTLTVAPSPTPTGWVLANIEPFGDLQGEGIWQPYLYSLAGEVVAYRTFLQPDPERPYTLVAVVAFDLTKTDLRFVLGLEEPSKTGGPHGWGNIPVDDMQPGKLLAAFNGGFIAEHGGYGAMADGVTALAGRSGLATLAIYNDNSVRIGEWGTDFYVDGDYRAWRQNALMIVHNGEINEKVYTGTEAEWGANLDGATVTMRSAVGISEDNSVLYYFAGPSLSMPVLADAMVAAGAHNGMLLDINPTHAHFTAMRVVDGKLTAEALYPEEMDLWVDRYLHQWDQDFFYVIVKE